MADQTPDSEFWVKRQQFTPKTYRDVYPAIMPTNPSFSQAGRVVIITGASQGLGAKSFANSFAATGPKAIVLVARNAKKLEEVAAALNEKFPKVETLTVPTDIADPASVAALFEKVNAKYGHADVLINNAAVMNAKGLVKEVDQKGWWDDMTININGTFLVTQNFLRSLPDSAPAKIITQSSGAALEAIPTTAAYGLAKLVVLQLQTYIAAENPNVLAVTMHPGIVMTDMTQDAFIPFSKDTPELAGGLATWLAAWEGVDRSFLSGRFVSANWDVENLVERKDEIVKGGLLKMQLAGPLGPQ